MSYREEVELVPRNGHTLIVGIVARISGCQNQKELSLEDQVDHGKEIAREYYDGEIDFRIIATTGKGERLDRPELAEVEARLTANEFDLLTFEDVGRLVRGVTACFIFATAVDQSTRVISPNDDIDTNHPDWEAKVMDACKEHMKHNEHTSRRIKQKKMNRFKKYGAATPCPIAGYIKPDGAETFSDWSKDEEAIEYLKEGLQILRRTLNGEAVAEYFNEVGFSPGPYCKNEKWDGKMTLRYYRNSILKGLPARGTMHTTKKHKTGRRSSTLNPKGPTYREEPHLAFFSPDEIDPVLEALEKKNAHYKRKKKTNGVDSRYQVPKKRTRAFGQHATCYYCGHHYVWGANGITDSLMCSNSRSWHCWNSIGFNGPEAAQKLLGVILESLSSLEGIDAQYQEILQQAQSGGPEKLRTRENKLNRAEEEIEREGEKIKKLVREVENFNADILYELSSELTERKKKLSLDRVAFELAKNRQLNLPKSTLELKEILLHHLEAIDIHSHEFGDLIRELVPEIYVYQVRLIDGGHLLPRAKIRLNLAGSIPDAAASPELQQLLTRELTLDLFEPPQRELIRPEAIRLATVGMEQREIARQLEGKPTQTAVYYALFLHRQMQEEGLSSPYIFLEEPPEDYKKLRRHKNKKYSFQVKAGYQRPPL
ncbi:recombinase family protein [Gimesia sp.]|uniref:recombinase family protein n=1 Tax=Gimesia sp. TaxID=2024833 RepID=UPI003A928DF4